MVAGLTDGFEEVDVNPDGLLVHEYVLPLTEVAPMAIDAPEQMAVLAIIEAAGKALTVTVTGFDFVQPVAVIVSARVYVVVTIGFTIGLDKVEVNPVGELVHE